jgi:toxin YoeB
MTFSIFWSPKAEAEFIEILIYLESEFGINITLRCMEDVEKMLDHIAEFPFAFVSYDDGSVRRAVVNKQLSIFYRINEGIVELLSFWDNRRDLETLNI